MGIFLTLLSWGILIWIWSLQGKARARNAQEAQRVPVYDEIGVVGHVAARRAEMDDAGGGGRGLAIGIDVRHDVVADFLLPRFHAFIVDIRDMGGQLVHLFLRHRQAEFHLRLRQRHPQPPPGLVAGVRGEQLQHIL